MSELEELADVIRQCDQCLLSQERTQAVPGEGDDRSGVMFIGVGPGFHEDRQGRPFVGAAGQFLDELLASIGMDRSQVYITNMVKCRPPGNRDPFPSEVEACSKYLDAQISILNPKVIVTLGRHSLSKFFTNEKIMQARGKPRPWKNTVVLPVLHPAAALYRSQLKDVMIKDFQAIPSLLSDEESSSHSDDQTPHQLSML